MKTLLLLRHAKTEPENPEGDKARELTKRGRRDAVAIAAPIRDAGLPDILVVSDARRAQQTAALVAGEIGFAGPLLTEPAIYAADPETLLRVVQRLPDSADRALLIGHNPGFEEIAAHLADEILPRLRLPTAGLVHLEFDIAAWREAAFGSGRLRGMHTPRGGDA